MSLTDRILQEASFATEQHSKLSLKERIAERKEQERRAMVRQLDAQQTEELMAGADPTIGMSTAEKLGAGFQSGLRNIGRNVGNIAGVVSDDSLSEATRRDAPLGNTGAGAAGQFAGEMAGLAPLSLGTAGIRGAAGALKSAKSFPKALKAARGAELAGNTGRGIPGVTRAMAEGGAAGAILAGEGDRGEAALDSALMGGALNKTLGSLTRKFGKGFNSTEAAKKFDDIVSKETGRSTNLTVAQSASNALVKYPHKSILSMFPTARGGSHKMAKKAQEDWTEAVIRRSFKKEAAEAAAKVYTETGDVVKAFNAGEALMGKSPYLGANRRVLRELTQGMRAGEPLTPKRLDAVAKKLFKESGESRPFYDLSSVGEEVLGEAIEESTVSGRRAYNKLMNAAVTGLGANVAGVVPYAALAAGTRGATSAPVQNFMMGRGAMNPAITNSAESLYADALRNAIAGQ